jgi:hypothetical protein
MTLSYKFQGLRVTPRLVVILEEWRVYRATTKNLLRTAPRRVCAAMRDGSSPILDPRCTVSFPWKRESRDPSRGSFAMISWFQVLYWIPAFAGMTLLNDERRSENYELARPRHTGRAQQRHAHESGHPARGSGAETAPLHRTPPRCVYGATGDHSS